MLLALLPVVSQSVVFIVAKFSEMLQLIFIIPWSPEPDSNGRTNARLKSASSLSMNWMSPVAPVLEMFFHRLEIMKFQDHRNPDSSCSYLALVFPSGWREITELVSPAPSATSLVAPLILSTMPRFMPCTHHDRVKLCPGQTLHEADLDAGHDRALVQLGGDEDEAVAGAVDVLVVGAERGAGHLQVRVSRARHEPKPRCEPCL